jgi:uncharacterized membrane protein YbhN (UPF0104 family)
LTADEERSEFMVEKIFHRITPYIGFVLFLAAILIVHHELKMHSIKEILTGLGQMPMSVILPGVLLTGINYLCLTGYDFMALRYLGRSVRPRNVIIASLQAGRGSPGVPDGFRS